MSTTIPTDLSPENLLMYSLTINDICLQEIGRQTPEVERFPSEH